jgi:hypothetical protein
MTSTLSIPSFDRNGIVISIISTEESLRDGSQYCSVCLKDLIISQGLH